ncbi:MAG: (Fe-S)-binding protein [Desulfocucumaceae bacterium]
MLLVLKEDITREYLKKCVRCGQCRYVCPVLAEAGKESASPRGKVYLAGMLQRGEAAPGPGADRILSLCLTCGACSTECPSGLPVDSIITSARALSASSRPNTPERIAFRQFFLKQQLLGKIPGFTQILRLVMARGSGIAAGGPARALIPATARPDKKKPRLKVGYFLGCATNFLLPDVAKCVVEVLRHLGCEVVTPPALCCGLPLETSGETGLAAGLLERNRRLFSEQRLDAVVTDCSSCSYHLTEKGFSQGSQPVYEFSEFLSTVLEPSRPGRDLGGRAVTCHDPCHIRFGRKLAGQSRQVLEVIPGLKLVDTPGGSSCCGGGGTFSLKHRELSAGILRKNIERIKSSGVERVSTVCPSCIIQISRGLKLSGGIAVCHPAQLLHESYGLPG